MTDSEGVVEGHDERRGCKVCVPAEVEVRWVIGEGES